LLGAGNHSLQLFYDDLNTTGAELDFTVNTQNVSTAPPPPTNGVPEPASLALAAAALLVAGMAGRRGRR
jgi:hypothetical protein